jgi:aerobic-type carbon monoxide dehydrogenase small subunit (CoxS/CutS family)
MNLRLTLNDERRSFEIAGDEPLIDILRDAGLASVRLSCGIGLCGACTVLLDGDPVSSCLLHAALAEGRAVTTVEGLAPGDPVLRAFDEAAAFQCGYCTPGMVLSAKALASHNPGASPGEIRHWMNGNLCRCGSYRRIEQAIGTYLEEVSHATRDV